MADHRELLATADRDDLLEALMREVTTEDYDTVRSMFGAALWLFANPDRAYAWGQVLTEHTSPVMDNGTGEDQRAQGCVRCGNRTIYRDGHCDPCWTARIGVTR